jgi:hypothetical protein
VRVGAVWARSDGDAIAKIPIRVVRKNHIRIRRTCLAGC